MICKISRMILLTSVILLVHNGLFSQQKAEIYADRNRILIGDHIKLLLSYSFPAEGIAVLPQFDDTLTGNIEVVSVSKWDTVFLPDKKKITLSSVITVSCYDSGMFYIPPFSFCYHMADDTVMFCSQTSALPLYVNTVTVDTARAFKDIKEPISVPLTLSDVLPWIIGGAIATILLAVLTVLYILYKKRKTAYLFSKPVGPPHIRALNALESLRTQRLWQQNKIKEYHTILTDIVRNYIDERFNVNAPEMISEDIVIQLTEQYNDFYESIKLLQKTLNIADMVKFAKYNPLPDEHDSSLRNAIAFVNATAQKVSDEAESVVNNNSENEYFESLKKD